MHRPSGPFWAIVLPFVCLPLVLSCSSGGGSSTTTVGVGPGSTTTTLSLSPQSGAVGTLLQITGQDFDLVATNNKIEFTGGAQGLAEIATATTILTRVPSGAVSGPVKVVAAGKTQLSGKFTVLPSITAVAPAKATVGSIFSVQGNGFDIENLANNRVTISGQEAIPTDVTPSFLNAQVPIGAKSGPVEVLVGGVSAIGSASLVVPPSILSFTPEEGLIGTPVTIQGFGFSENLNANAVKFNGVQAVVASASYFTIETQVPPGSSTGPVTVTVSGETAVGAVDFAVNLPPIVTGFAPAKGVKGAVVSVLGQNFNGNAIKNQVSFGAFPAVVQSAVPTKLDVIVPPEIPDQTPALFVTVTTNAGSSTSPTAFDVDYPPVIDDFYPKTATAGSLLSIDGMNFSETPSANTVTIGGVPANVVGASLESLVVTIPAGGVSGLIQVTTADGVATSVDNFQTYFPRFAYVSNSGDNTVSSYAVDATSGRLRHNGFVFAGAAKTPRGVAVSPDGTVLYVTHFAADEVALYTIGTNGIPEPFSSPTVPAGDGPTAIVVHPSGKYAWVLNQTPATISQYTISNGNLVPQLAPAISTGGTTPTTLTIDPAGKNLYATNIVSGTVAMFSIGDDGLLSSLGVVAAGAGWILQTGPASVVFHPNGQFAFVANSNESKVYHFAVSEGVLVPLFDGGGVQVTTAAGNVPIALAFDATAQFLYAANRTSNDVSIFQVDGATGLLTPAGALALPAIGTTAAAPAAMAAFEGNLFVLGNGTTELSQLSIAGGTGQLSLAHQIRVRTTPFNVAFALGNAKPKHTPLAAYLGITGTPKVKGYGVNPATGALNFLGESVSPTFVSPTINWITVHPQNKFFEVALLGDALAPGTFGFGPIEPTLGTPGDFTPVGIVGGGANPPQYNAKAVELDKSGRYLIQVRTNYAASPVTSHLAYSLLDPLTGNFVSGATPVNYAANAKTQSLVLEPAGRFAYVAHPGTSAIQAHNINSNTGAVANVGAAVSLGTGTYPFAVAAHPSGRFVYAGYGKSAPPAGNNGIRLYLLSTTGALTQQQEVFLSADPLLDSGTSIAVDVLGRFLFVIMTDGSIQTWSINSTDGTLSNPVTNTLAALTGNAPFSLAVESSGKFLLVANSGDTASGNNLVSLNIDGSGSLSLADATAGLAGEKPKSVAVANQVQ